MNMMVSAATLATTAIPAIEQKPDPIFAFIDAHRRAYEETNRVFRSTTGDVPDTIAEPLLEAEQQAQLDLITAPPATIEGAAALIRHAVSMDQNTGLDGYWLEGLVDDEDPATTKWGRSWHYFMLRNVLSTLERLSA